MPQARAVCVSAYDPSDDACFNLPDRTIVHVCVGLNWQCIWHLVRPCVLRYLLEQVWCSAH